MKRQRGAPEPGRGFTVHAKRAEYPDTGNEFASPDGNGPETTKASDVSHQVRTAASSLSSLTSRCREMAAILAGSWRFLRRPGDTDPFCVPTTGLDVGASSHSPSSRSRITSRRSE